MPPSFRGKSKPSAKVETSSNVPAMTGNENDLDRFAQEVVAQLIADNLPPTPNNYALYFDRLLETKSETFKKQIHSIIELEESNDAENTIILEQTLKQGFVTIKNILNLTASLYKNMTLMSKILEKRKKELLDVSDTQEVKEIAQILGSDIQKLNTILQKQSVLMKEHYEEAGTIVKKVEQESIFDNKFGVYNRRYLFAKIEKERELIKEFKHKSSLIMIELSKELKSSIHNEKIITLMTRTIARLLLKTSRRSDTVAHYGKGVFAMLLKHTDLESAKKASQRLCELVANSNFFLADKEIPLKISIGIAEVNVQHTVEEIIVYALDAIEKAYVEENCYGVALLEKEIKHTKEEQK